MNHIEYNWISGDNKKLFGQAWKVSGKPKGIINIVHGIGEHSSRYEKWAEMFVEKGFSVLAIDYRGHGRSEGKRGHSPSYEGLMNDVSVLLYQSEILFPGVPKFLYGHSMGANLALNYILRKTPLIYGIIVTSPWLRLAFEPPKNKIMMGNVLKHLMPGLLQSTNLNVEHLSRDNKVVKDYKEDELVHDKMSIGQFFSVNEAGYWAIENAHKIYVPILIMHGSDDQITSPQGTLDFAKGSNGLTTLKIWDGGMHELHNDIIRNEVHSFITSWLEKTVNPKAADHH